MQGFSTLVLSAPVQMQQRATDVLTRRQNDVVWALILIPIAVIFAMGLIAAWFWYCQSRGMWPAFDMPSWQSGGTFKLYCKR
jgi:hypothetical protein